MRLRHPQPFTTDRRNGVTLAHDRRKYERSHDWMERLMMMEQLELNSPDDQVQLIAALTATEEVFEHPEFSCIWRFLLHFGFMDPDGNVLPAWEQYWTTIGRQAWQDGHRDRWIGWSDAMFPTDIGPGIETG